MQLFDSYLDKLRPAAREIGVKAETYAQRIISRLDVLIDSVQQDDTIYQRKQFTFTLSSTIPTITVPSTETWTMEVLSLSVFNSPVLTLIVNGTPILQFFSVYNEGGTTLPIRFPGGTEITFTASVYSGNGYFQCRVERLQPKKLTNQSGQIEQYSPIHGEQGTYPENRHVSGQIHNGVPAMKP